MADLSPPRSCSSGVARPTRCSWPPSARRAHRHSGRGARPAARADPDVLRVAAHDRGLLPPPARDPHHLRRRVGSFGAGALWALGEGPLLIEWITVAMVGGVVVAFVEALKRGLGEVGRPPPGPRPRGSADRCAEPPRVRGAGRPRDRPRRPRRALVCGGDRRRRPLQGHQRPLRARGDAALRLVATLAAAPRGRTRPARRRGVRRAAGRGTVSVGVAVLQDPGTSAEGLLDAADGAL